MKGRPQPSVTKSRMRGTRCARSQDRVLRDPRKLSHVFRAFEGLTELGSRCTREVNRAEYAEFYSPYQYGRPSPQQWRRLREEVLTSWRLFSGLVRDHRLNPAQLEDTYRRLLDVKATWAKYAPQRVPQGLIDWIIDHVRALLIACAAHR